VRVVVHHFAVLRERRGCSTETVEVEAGLSLRALYESLFPGPEAAMRVGFARNAAWASPDDLVSDGDEVAFLPPLGGG
jgi:molybdopterin converting factor small subunit